MLQDDELHSLYRSPNIVKMIEKLRWEDHVAKMEEGRSAFKIFKGTPAGKIPLVRSRHR